MTVKERIKEDGKIRIPQEMMEILRLKVGEEVEMSIKGDKLVIRARPEGERKKIRISPEIVDKLVEEEELFEPEWT